MRDGSDEVELMREKIKILFLGTNYGMSLRGLVWRLNGDVGLAEFMWRKHREHYKTFWRWVQRSLDNVNADMRSHDWTMFGWHIRVMDDVLKPDWATKMNTLQLAGAKSRQHDDAARPDCLGGGRHPRGDVSTRCVSG